MEELHEETIREIEEIVLDAHECCADCNTLARIIDFYNLVENIDPTDIVDEKLPRTEPQLLGFFLDAGAAIDWLNIFRTTLMGALAKGYREGFEDHDKEEM